MTLHKTSWFASVPFTFAVAMALGTSISAQDNALGRDDLSPHVFPFRLDAGVLEGPGAEVLLSNLADHHALLLGEYHNSVQISLLTSALIPHLHANNYNVLALEIGPAAAHTLSAIAQQANDTDGLGQALATLNRTYAVQTEDRTQVPVPFVSHAEDIPIISAASEREWNLIGIDQEFIYGFQLVIDGAAAKLESNDPRLIDIKALRNLIDDVYAGDQTGRRQAAHRLHNSKEIQRLIESLATGDDAIAEAVRGLRDSIQIYGLNASGDWWESNGRRIDLMKRSLTAGLNEASFDLGNDRLVLKAGSVHTGRGLSLLRHYEVGNTVSELMEANGQKSLHIVFAERFWESDDGVVDSLSTDRRYEVIRQFGQVDQWTLIDLRPLKRSIFYDVLECEQFVKEWFLQHDVVLIPPADRSSSVVRE